MPPIKACDDLTDEDSGDEDNIDINNLPASQRRAEAELFISVSNDTDGHDGQ